VCLSHQSVFGDVNKYVDPLSWATHVWWSGHIHAVLLESAALLLLVPCTRLGTHTAQVACTRVGRPSACIHSAQPVGRERGCQLETDALLQACGACTAWQGAGDGSDEEHHHGHTVHRVPMVASVKQLAFCALWLWQMLEVGVTMHPAPAVSLNGVFLVSCIQHC
jgi:hypothetical protein